MEIDNNKVNSYINKKENFTKMFRFKKWIKLDDFWVFLLLKLN